MPPGPAPSETGEDTPNPVGHFAFEGPAPASAATRVIGTAATALLIVLGIGTLALRLTVGWPRFPVLYLGRRRPGTRS